MLNPNDPEVQIAVFGEQVTQFLQSDIGSYLLERAKNMSEVATRELKDADPFIPERICALQLKIKTADNIIEWLGEAIDMGLQAQQNMEHS